MVQVGMATSIVVPLSVSYHAYLSKVNNRVKCLTICQVIRVKLYNNPVHPAYNPSFSTCFFSRNSIFLSQQISQQCFSAGLSAHPNRANSCLVFVLKKVYYYYVVPCLTFSFLFLVDHLCLYLSQPMPMLSCPTYWLHESKALLSPLFSPLC
jgi:hypothetical protein